MLPNSQPQQKLRHIRRLVPLSPCLPPRFGKLGRESVSHEQFAQSSQLGFTIVEALLAIIVVTILMIGVAPVLVLATANRVQAKRVELAVNAAKSYIDRVRTDPSLTPPINSGNNRSSAQYFALIQPPRSGGTLVCNATSVATKGYCSAPTGINYKLFCVDGDGDGRCTKNSLKDMVVQAFGYQANNTGGTPGTTVTDEEKAKQGYQLGIRVYRADAFQDNAPLESSSNTFLNKTKALAGTNTAGLGDRKAPLVEMTTQIVTDDTDYSGLCSQLGGCK